MTKSLSVIDSTKERIRRLFRRWRPVPINNAQDVAKFIDENSAFVAQSSLYGYIKTRAGFEYFRLFEDPAFLQSINIAKWNIYAECVGDLTIFCGAHLRHLLPQHVEAIPDMMNKSVTDIFAVHDKPEEAGDEYPDIVRNVCKRISDTTWEYMRDDESPFSKSPEALVYWAPVSDTHKVHDAGIVRNSISFKWKEIRANFRRRVHAESMSEYLSGVTTSSADSRNQ